MNSKQLVLEKYKEFCKSYDISFQENYNVKSYDNSTLFCPAGMQQFKHKFKDEIYKGTVANIQSCIRMNDLDEIGDGSHLLSFDMLGLFSFREMDVFGAVEFWWNFIESLGIKVDYVTIHPDKYDWKYYYPMNFDVRTDIECKWSDGEIGGYCTEFFVGDLEIGNIVNPLGNCIDVGFGLSRIALLLGDEPQTKLEVLQESAIKIIDSGFVPSNKMQGYVLRKILREIYKLDGSIDSLFFIKEIERQQSILDKYNRLKDKHIDKSDIWWYDTHGIDLNIIREEVI